MIKNKLNRDKKFNYIRNSISIILVVLIVTLSVKFYLSSKGEVEYYKPDKEISLLLDGEIGKKVQESIYETYDNYLKEYSEYFNLDGDKVVEFARSISDNYNIDLNELIGGRFTSETKEGKCMLFVYYLSKNKLVKPLSEYNYSKDYFKVSSKMVTLNDDLTVRNGLSFSEFLGKVCDNLGMDKYYLLAISYLETGRVTSSLALNKNNFGGLRGSGSYFSYPSPEMGIISFCLNLKGYEKYNFNNIYELSGMYTHGNKNNPSNTWVSSVLKYYNEIKSNPNKYFLVEDL